jgi:hypothetical protein
MESRLSKKVSLRVTFCGQGLSFGPRSLRGLGQPFAPKRTGVPAWRDSAVNAETAIVPISKRTSPSLPSLMLERRHRGFDP